MTADRVQVVILGRGIAGSMAAAHLAQALPRRQVTILVIAPEHGDHGPFGEVEASLPSVTRWNARWGLDEGQLVREGCLSFSLGTAYSGWSPVSKSSFQPFGETGSVLDGVAFHQFAERLRQAGTPIRLADFSIAALAAQAGRFARPSSDIRTPLSLLDYGLHIDQPRYATLLLQAATQRGATLMHGSVSGVEKAPNGDIAALRLADGTRVPGDLFIDASGAKAELISHVEGSAWTSFAQWLSCDGALEITRRTAVPPAPYAHVVAEPSGWRRIVPTLGRLTETISYKRSGAEPPVEVGDGVERFVAHAYEQGRLEHAWVRNCVAIAHSAVLLEPTFPFGLHLTQSMLGHLVRLFPAPMCSDADRREFNRHFAQEADRSRDVVIARYLLSGSKGAFWDRVRAMEPPAELAYKIELFRSRGRLSLLDGDVLEDGDWACLFDAQGLRARRYDALSDTLPLELVQSQAARMRDVMIAAVARLPIHADFLAAVARGKAA